MARKPKFILSKNNTTKSLRALCCRISCRHGDDDDDLKLVSLSTLLGLAISLRLFYGHHS